MPRRATWVGTRPDVEELISWARAHDVGSLFLSVRPRLGPDLTLVNATATGTVDEDVQWVREVVRRAHQATIEVSALGGDPTWVGNPEAGLSWLRAVIATGLFDGVHVDIEPWTRDDWDRSRAEVVANYLLLLRQLAAACHLPLEADITFWLHKVPTATGGPLDSAVMQIVDSVTVLSFRNTVTGLDSITGIAAHALATANRSGIPCRLAVETNDLGPDPVARKQTFFGATRIALARALAEVDTIERRVASYNGIAVEDYAGWTALRAALPR